MRKIKFQPMPGLTIVLVICVTILISLGVWQYQRLQWKTALLAEVEASVSAPPLKGLDALSEAIRQEAPIDFRRIAFTGKPQNGGSIYHLYSSQTGGIYWDIIEPIKSEGRYILAKTSEVNAQQKTTAPNTVIAPDSLSAPQSYIGYIRKTYPMGRVESWVKPKANIESNRYFYFDQNKNWYETLPTPNFEGYYIDVVEKAQSAETLPVKRPEIANNHFDYMLTWWSFALIFVVIYLILHRRAGRLQFV
ncbi:cytochrome oxidase assembly protein ShyY1 [Litorimonas taeanensis]|uniref:SURF1-like protein n=1 Tax=Litorimonas taeanensis TaxID=568099 RepID=A0A420WE47_9PROT|nr:SURF1 family protein [Litorimonas taeanensis]RKQ69266.1 cytochrome oxidase assembly protein ShyY1 [Litorimonas taeanensis]